MKSKIAERILAKTPEDVKIFTSLYAALVVKVNRILKEQNLSQKALADLLGKRPSEIHKWLSGEHNFTLRSIAKLQAELGEPLIEIPIKRSTAERFSYSAKTTRAFTVHRNIASKVEASDVWLYHVEQTQLANVG